jgi:hypothetical protein
LARQHSQLLTEAFDVHNVHALAPSKTSATSPGHAERGILENPPPKRVMGFDQSDNCREPLFRCARRVRGRLVPAERNDLHSTVMRSARAATLSLRSALRASASLAIKLQ